MLLSLHRRGVEGTRRTSQGLPHARRRRQRYRRAGIPCAGCGERGCDAEARRQRGRGVFRVGLRRRGARPRRPGRAVCGGGQSGPSHLPLHVEQVCRTAGLAGRRPRHPRGHRRRPPERWASPPLDEQRERGVSGGSCGPHHTREAAVPADRMHLACWRGPHHLGTGSRGPGGERDSVKRRAWAEGSSGCETPCHPPRATASGGASNVSGAPPLLRNLPRASS
mmetsp:Transcript_37374/g.88571  ORF Transcript_37374/g.88571 Transcript_37374/m.88571 type:complete len:223 (+) Transcript_37374:829-1497(+)